MLTILSKTLFVIKTAQAIFLALSINAITPPPPRCQEESSEFPLPGLHFVAKQGRDFTFDN
jgi:hypothetical protein